jgi:hypothetical protein
MATKEDVIAGAHREVGVAESPAGSNRTKYGAWYGMNGVSWCAIFLSYVFWHAGLPLRITTDKGFSYCPFGQTWFKNMGLWTRMGGGRFFVGDLAFYQFDADVAPDHVGLIIETKRSSVVAIEGNTSATNRGSQNNGGQVAIRERPLSLIIGVGHPQYAAPPPPAPKPIPWPGRYLTLASPYMKGTDVKQVQYKMVSWGSAITADGTFGPKTYDNVRWWQARFGLKADGVVGPETWRVFFSAK